MPVSSLNPYAGQAQAAAVNPFQQRGEDQVRSTSRRDTERAPNETRPADASAARSQQSETRSRQDESGETRQTQGRGSVVDIRV